MKTRKTQQYIMSEIDKLHIILKKGYWVQVSPLSRLNPENWIVAIYKRGKKGWTTQDCKMEFLTPKEAYDWAFDHINKKYDI